MNKFLMLFGCVFLAGALAAAQDSGGTINPMSSNPYQNQEMTNTMGSTSGQPTDLAGERDLPSGLVPQTTAMEGSGSNGNLNQSEPAVPLGGKANNAEAAKPAPKAQAKRSQSAGVPSHARKAAHPESPSPQD